MPRAQLTPGQRQFLTDLLNGRDGSKTIGAIESTPVDATPNAETSVSSSPSKAARSAHPGSLLDRLIHWLFK